MISLSNAICCFRYLKHCECDKDTHELGFSFNLKLLSYSGLVLILIELSLIQKLLLQISKVCHIKVASLTILLEWQAVLSIYITMSEYFREKSHPIL